MAAIVDIDLSDAVRYDESWIDVPERRRRFRHVRRDHLHRSPGGPTLLVPKGRQGL